MSVYNILIVDDHPIVREGIKVVLSRIDGVVCTLCDSVEQLANMLSRNANYDLYVLDLEFPKADVFPILGKINELYPDAKILIYSMHEEPCMLAHIDTYKIHGYVSKNDSIDSLLGAVCKIRDGGEAFGEDYIKASISNGGAYINIEVSLFDKMTVTLTAHRDGVDVYNLLEIGMIYLHPNYLPYSYQLIRVIDHVAWVLGCEKSRYMIMSSRSFEMGFLYENGYQLNIVDMDGFIYLEKHYREEYGYIIRNEGQEN